MSKVMGEDVVVLVVLWLGDIFDEEEMIVRFNVWKGGKKQLKWVRGCVDYEGLEDGEEFFGEVELMVRLWRGLSGYYKYIGGKLSNKLLCIRSVLEVLDMVNDEKMIDYYDDLDLGFDFFLDLELFFSLDLDFGEDGGQGIL